MVSAGALSSEIPTLPTDGLLTASASADARPRLYCVASQDIMSDRSIGRSLTLTFNLAFIPLTAVVRLGHCLGHDCTYSFSGSLVAGVRVPAHFGRGGSPA